MTKINKLKNKISFFIGYEFYFQKKIKNSVAIWIANILESRFLTYLNHDLLLAQIFKNGKHLMIFVIQLKKFKNTIENTANGREKNVTILLYHTWILRTVGTNTKKRIGKKYRFICNNLNG